MTKEKFNDYTKINYSFLKPSQEDYKTFSEYWEAMTNQQDGYLSTGDLAEINMLYNGSSAIVEGEVATIRLVAKNGAVKPVGISTPSAMIDSITYLYP